MTGLECLESIINLGLIHPAVPALNSLKRCECHLRGKAMWKSMKIVLLSLNHVILRVMSKHHI